MARAASPPTARLGAAYIGGRGRRARPRKTGGWRGGGAESDRSADLGQTLPGLGAEAARSNERPSRGHGGPRWRDQGGALDRCSVAGARRRRAKKGRRIEVAAPRGRGRSRRGRPLAEKADGGGACPTYFMPGQSGQSEGRRRGGDRTRRESGLRRGYGLLGAKRRKGNVVATPTRPAREGAERLRDTAQRRGRQSQFRRERRGGRAKWPPAESPLQNKNFPE